MLIGLRPTVWNKTIIRLEAIRRYLDCEERTAEAAEREAAKLGMSRSMFYLLARIYDRQRTMRQAPHRQRARGDVTKIAGSGSEEIEERDAAAWKAAGFALPPNATRRSDRMPVIAGDPIDAIVDVTADFVIDRAYLYVDVDLHGKIWNTELVGLIDRDESRLIDHLLTIGPPDPARIIDLMASVPKGRTVAISARDPEIGRPQIFSAAESMGIEIVTGDWRPCRAMWTVTGPRIGNIRLLERPIPNPPHPVVDHRLLERIVDRLVEVERTRSSS